MGILSMDSTEKVFKWGSFFPSIEITRDDHRQWKRQKGSSSLERRDAAAPSSSATGSTYLSLVTGTCKLVDRQYDIFTDDIDICDSNPAQADLDTKLHWWGIRSEPFLLEEVMLSCSVG
jgi:hypothetical protein